MKQLSEDQKSDQQKSNTVTKQLVLVDCFRVELLHCQLIVLQNSPIKFSNYSINAVSIVL